MALTRKEVRITFTVKDEATGDTQRITKSMQKNMTKLTESITTVKKEMGKTTRQTRTFETVQRSMGQQVNLAAKSISKFGRRMVFTGFIMGAVTRRVVRAFKGIMRAFAGVLKEGADVDKQLDWLGSTIEALAFGGADLEGAMGDIMRVFDDSFNNARDLREEIAEIDIHFKDIKNAITGHTIPALESFNDELDLLDWESITDGVGDAVDAFFNELIPAFATLATDENLFALLVNMEALGTAGGAFSAGFIDGIADMIGSLADIDTILGGDDDGIKGLAWWAGEATSKLALIAIPTIVVGALISAVASIVGAIGAIPTAILITIAFTAGSVLKFLANLKKTRDGIEKVTGAINDLIAAQSKAGMMGDSQFKFDQPTVPGGTTVGPFGGTDPGFADRIAALGPFGETTSGFTEPPPAFSYPVIPPDIDVMDRRARQVQAKERPTTVQTDITLMIDGKKIAKVVNYQMGRRIRNGIILP